MELTDQQQAALREVFRDVHRIGSDTLAIDDPGDRSLRRLSDALALKSGAMLSGLAAEKLLMGACEHYLEKGEDAAIAHVQVDLRPPLRRWKVIRPCRMYLGSDAVDVGFCHIQRGLPHPPPGVSYLEPSLKDFPALSISTEVEAYDEVAARILAEQTIAEALAVLQLSHWDSVPILGRAVIVHQDDGTVSYNPDPVTALMANRGIHEGGQLGPLQEALSVAAGKPLATRTDWERRTLAAARWVSKGIGSAWPSDALLSFIVCLETLFVPSKRSRGMGVRIATGISNIVLAAPMNRREQRKWLLNIYDRRTEAVHEGREPPTDVDVSRLRLLAWTAIVWGAGHLVHNHQPRGMPCTTFEEAHADHFPSKEPPLPTSVPFGYGPD